MISLPLIFGAMIAFCVVMYVVLDGFTLGTTMLFPYFDAHQRDIASSMILPTWDGNQTWLVLGMASLYGAFPLAFSTILPILYVPLILMVIALLFRGVSFEFRLKAHRGKARWDFALCASSYFIAFIQGLMVGAMAQGLQANDLFNSFSIATGFGVIIAYGLLGATRLIFKTDHEVQSKCFRLAKLYAVLFVLAVLVVCVWTPFVHQQIYSLWFGEARQWYLFLPPVLCALLALSLWLSLKLKLHHLPFYLSVGLVLGPYLGFIINLYPYAVPYRITYLQAAAPHSTLSFLVVGAGIMLPVLLLYTGYAYNVFKGKVRDVLHY